MTEELTKVFKASVINIEQSSDEWHEYRHKAVTGTVMENSVGACYTNEKRDNEGNLKSSAMWQLNGKTFELVGTKWTCTKQGSILKKCKDKQVTLGLELVSERQSILEIDEFCNAVMERGNDLEPISVDKASEKHGVKFETCGMLQSSVLKDFRFSPDAVVYNKDGVVIGGYETKSKAGKKHIEYMLADEVPAEHLWQCLCPMIMSDDVKWWIFGHYDDRNMVNDLFTVGIKREDYQELIQEARIVLVEFFEKLDKMTTQLGGIYND